MLSVSPAPVRKVTKKTNMCGSSGQHIKVFVRVRPMNESEKSGKAHCLVDCPTSKEVLVQERPLDKYTKKFSFDRVFDKQSKQTDIYKVVAKPLVEEVLNGFNCTIFAYGQTGTGKTFTMEGDPCPAGVRMEENMSAGIIPRCVNQLFDELRIQKLEFNMRVSFLELYNEELFDLLSAHDDLSKLRMYEDASRKGSCIVQGLEEVVVRNKSDVYSIIDKGSSKRQTAATLMNAHSSRSHTVFTVTVHIKENTMEGDELLKTGKLHLVDLAGSENIGRSGAVDKRAREAGNINQSLLTLGRVITSLVEKAPHVPYRESKLTRLLQDALGGRTKTSIIATISPASVNLEETLSTLDYAHRAKNIQNKPEVNQKLNKKELICEYTNEIEKLRRDLLAMREKNGVYLANENYQEMILTMEQQSREIMEKISLIRGLESEMEKHIEMFTEVSLELKDTNEKLSTTESKLSQTEEVLQLTQNLLNQTVVERDEQKHLVGAHVKTEGELHVQGKNLVNVAKTTTSDISKLHDKLDRKRKVEAMNEETEKTFAREFEERVQAMHASVYAFKEHHNRNSTDVVDELGSCTESSLKRLDEMSEHLKPMNALMLSALQKGSSFFDRKVDDFVEKQSDVCDSIEKKALGEEEILKQFVSDVFCPLVQKMADHLTQHHSSIQSMKTSFQSKISAMSELWSSVYREQCSLLATMEEHLGELVEFPPRLQEEIRQKSDFLQENTRSHSEVLKKLVQTISEQIDQHSTSMSSQFPLLTSKQSEDLSKAHDISKKMLGDVSTLTKLSSDHNTMTIQHEKDTVELLTSGVEKIKMETKDVEKKTFDLKEKVEEQVSQSSSAFSDVAKVSEEGKEEVARKGKACKKEFKKEIQSTCTDVTTQFESCEEKVDEMRVLVQSSISQVQEKLERFESELEEFLVDHNDQLRETGDSVPALFKEQIAKDIPTGFTPDRREYLFPQNLVATSPHERILNRYRLRANSTSRIPVPNFNPEEEEDPVSSEQDSTPPSCNSSLISDGGKDTSKGFALPLSRSTSFNKEGQSIFALPNAPVRQESREDLSSTKQNSLSRSSSASSITDSKENLSMNSRKNPSLKKRELKPPSIIVNSEKLGTDAPVTRARKVLGNCN